MESAQHFKKHYVCPKQWEELEGDDAQRHCVSCNKAVINLDGLTDHEAKQLFDTQSSPCVRFNPINHVVNGVRITITLLAFAVCLFAVFRAQAQSSRDTEPKMNTLRSDTCWISGQVVDQDGEGIPFAMVRVFQEEEIGLWITDFGGNFETPILNYDIVKLEVSFLGQKKLFSDIRLSKEPVNLGIIQLQDFEPTVIGLVGLIVPADPPPIDFSIMESQTTITREQIERSPSR